MPGGADSSIEGLKRMAAIIDLFSGVEGMEMQGAQLGATLNAVGDAICMGFLRRAVAALPDLRPSCGVCLSRLARQPRPAVSCGCASGRGPIRVRPRQI